MENQDKIARIIADALEVNPGRVLPGVHFMDDLGADSLTMIEVLARLETSFGITIDQSELARMVTLETVCAVVREAHALTAPAALREAHAATTVRDAHAATTVRDAPAPIA